MQLRHLFFALVCLLAAIPAAPASSSLRTERIPGIPATHDFNGDGYSDILWRNDTTGQGAIWYSPNLTPATYYTHSIWLGADYYNQMPADTQRLSPIDEWIMAGIGDADADGESDGLWRYKRSEGRIQIWRSASIEQSYLASAAVSNQAWQIAAMGDYDGDGASDTLWRNGQRRKRHLAQR